MSVEKTSVWNIICNIFDELNIFQMKNYDRVILKNGVDIGLRENNRGAIFIVPKIYFANPKVQGLIKTLSESSIVKRQKTSKK